MSPAQFRDQVEAIKVAIKAALRQHDVEDVGDHTVETLARYFVLQQWDSQT